MKYCSHCGSPMEDEMNFCQKCGTRFVPEKAIRKQTPTANKGATSFTHRKGMNFFGGVFAILTVTAAVMAITEDPSMIALVGFCLVLSGMFFVLAKTSAKSKFLFGESSGIKKSLFIGLSILLAFVLFSVLSSVYGETDESTQLYALIQNTIMI